MRNEEIFGLMVDAARARGVRDIEAILATENQALTRFANNAISQNVSEQSRHLSVRTVIDGRTARASTNRVDREGIDRVVEQAIAITRSVEPDAELLPMAEPASYESATRFFEATARATPEERAQAVAEAIRVGGRVETDGRRHLLHRGIEPGAFQFARRGGGVSRDHGAILHHRDVGRQLGVGEGERMPSSRPGSSGVGALGVAQGSAFAGAARVRRPVSIR